MNRAEKRRQRRLAKKSRRLEPASGQPTGNATNIQQALVLALQHHEQGELSKAEGIYQQILKTDPNQPVALHMLGVIAHQVGKHDTAVDLITKALVIKPDYAEAHNNLGVAFQKLGKLDEAIASYHKALAIKPDDAEAHSNLGVALKDLGKLDEAVASYHKAVAIKPDLAEAHNNLGNAFKELGKLDEAIASYHKTLAIKPDYAEAHNNLGVAFQELGKLDEAIASYHKALAIKPDYAEARFSLTLLQLLMGDYKNGWEGYAQRWHVLDNPAYHRHYGKPVWNGSDPGRHRLLVWGEQGIGDVIFGATIIQDLIERGIDVVLETEPRLVPLLSRSFPEITCIANNDPSVYELIDEENDFFVPMGDLGRLFRPNLESFPDQRSYLVADPDRQALFRKRYKDQASGPLVGIAWTSKSPAFDKHNLFTLSDLHPLLKVPGIMFVDVQYGDTSQERQAFAEETGIHILHDDDVDQLVDIDTFASQLAALDLVIGLDNSLAALAGALGIPTWGILRTVPFWYWGLNREDSFWFPGIRLFRQQKRGEWDSVIKHAAQELADYKFPET